jgi:hypothetical protein
LLGRDEVAKAPAPDDRQNTAALDADEAANVRERAWRERQGFDQRLIAATQGMWTTRTLASLFSGGMPEAEEGFADRYMSHYTDIENGYDDDEIDQLRAATSDAGLVQIRHRIEDARYRSRVIDSNGTGFYFRFAATVIDLSPIILALLWIGLRYARKLPGRST